MISAMTKLSKTNPYLRNSAGRVLIRKSVASSSAIEGIRAPFREVSKSVAVPNQKSRVKKK
jgi:hypothetical protein